MLLSRWCTILCIKLCYISMNKKNARKNLYLCCVMLLVVISPASELKLWCDFFYFVVYFVSLPWLCVVRLYSAYHSREQTACCLRRPNVSFRSTFFSLVVLWAFAKHLGCCFPSSVSSVVPLTCVVHSCSPLFIKGCLPYLKKARRPLPEVWCLMRSLAWFVLFVFQWEASQQTHRPLLRLRLLCILKTEKLFLCHHFELNQPTIQNCVWNF